jgi:hypothetical protein
MIPDRSVGLRRLALPPQSLLAVLRPGVLPLAAVLSGAGMLAIGIADVRARNGIEPSEPFFWTGLALIVTPIALALWSPRPSRRERIGLVALLGLGLYSARVLYSPGAFVFHDEFSHWRTAIDISAGGRLLAPNPLASISPLFPGLETFTAMFASLSGLPMPLAGQIVVAVARTLVVLGLFVVFERASGSPRVAGLAVLFYAANPSFVFFDAVFSYESFALGLTATAVAALALRTRDDPRVSRGLTIVAGVAIVATAVTHHVTSYALVLLLVGWTVVGLIWRRRLRPQPAPVAAAAVAIVAAVGWLLLVASPTIEYIAPHVEGGISQVLQLIMGEATVRPLFQDASGVQAVFLERATAFASVILTLAPIPFGLWVIVRHRRERPLAIVLGLAAMLYPVSLALRLTRLGAETASRMSAFVFTGVGFAVALWGVSLVITHPGLVRRFAATSLTFVVFAGGVINGLAPWARLPYPYRPAADSRSVDLESISAAMWTFTHLGEHFEFVSDRTDHQLLGAYGQQGGHTFQGASAQILLSTQVAVAGRYIALLKIDYVMVDRRLSDALPLTNGGYVVIGELGGITWTSPLDPAALAKFDRLPGARRIFDSGDIQIYDVRSIR